MRTTTIALVILALALTAASWKKKGETDDYDVTVTQTVEVKQADAYQLKQALSKKQATMNKISDAGLTQAYGADLEQIASALKQGVSIANQKAALDAQVAEMPNVPKPVVEEVEVIE